MSDSNPPVFAALRALASQWQADGHSHRGLVFDLEDGDLVVYTSTSDCVDHVVRLAVVFGWKLEGANERHVVRFSRPVVGRADRLETIEVRVRTLGDTGKRRASFRVQNVSGTWPRQWHRMTVRDAEQALEAAARGDLFDIGGVLGSVRVVGA